MPEKKRKKTTKKINEKKSEETDILRIAEEELEEGQTPKPKPKRKEKKKAAVSKRKKKTPTDDDENIDENLQHIYENKDGSMPDMSHFQKKRRSRLLASAVFLFSIFLLAAVAWTGFVFFGPEADFSQRDVILSVSGEDEVMIGQEVTYRVRYGNGQHVPLAKAVLRVRYPQGFVFEHADPAPTAGSDTWEIGSLDQLDTGFIDITGRMFGSVDQTQSFRVFLNYFPGNFSSEFQSVATAEVTTKESPVSLSFDAPEEIAPGINTGFTLHIKKNEGVEGPLEHLLVLLEETDGFNKKESIPESDEFEAFAWSIDRLDEEAEITVNGSFSAEDIASEKTLTAKVIGWKDGDRERDGYEFAAAEHTIRLVQTDLGIDVVINGARGDFSVQPGEVLSTSIVIKNTGADPVRNVRAQLTFDAPSYNNQSILHWTALDDAEDGAIVGEQLSETIRRGTITWSRTHIPDFETLAPGESVTIDVHLPIKTVDVIDLTEFTTYDIAASVDVQYEANEDQSLVSSDPVNIVVNSDLDLVVRDEVSVSDLGEETHLITWLLNNSFHKIENLELTAEIYGDGVWDQDALIVPAGDAVFDEEAKKLTWTIDSMPIGVDVLALQYAVVLKDKNPSQTNLTSKVVLKALDVVTGQEMFILGDEILLNTEEIEE
jgi:hypothetical protein